MSKEGISGTKENPVDNSVEGQKKLKGKESSTDQQPGAVQRTAMGETAEERQHGRQEPDADGSTGLADSEETSEAIRTSPRAETRRGRTAQGKSGQGAMKKRSDPAGEKRFDNYADISPGKKRTARGNSTEDGNPESKDAKAMDDAPKADENFSHFESNNGNF